MGVVAPGKPAQTRKHGTSAGRATTPITPPATNPPPKSDLYGER
jgi:hypothetical protein